MGSLLSSLGMGSGSSSSSYNNMLQCCDGVVDPLTLLAVLGSIVGLTLFLRQAIIDKVVGRKKRKKRAIESSPQMYNLLPQPDTNQTLKQDWYDLLAHLTSVLLDEDNIFSTLMFGRIYVFFILNILFTAST